jgi:hypothetical protein
MTFPVSFWSIVAFAWLASRAYQFINKKRFVTPLTPAAAQAVFPRSAARKDVCEGAKYTLFLTLSWNIFDHIEHHIVYL